MGAMETALRSDPIYTMGFSPEERQRLIDQARLLEESTQQLFLDAGIGAGMTVLDVGCGVGDVSFLAAALVGDQGRVLGIDRDPRALAVARDRAATQGLTNVEFAHADIKDYETDRTFDALVGRLVLLYLAAPVDVLRGLIRLVRPDGVVAFQDYQFEHAPFSYPPVAQMEHFWEWFLTTFRRAGVATSMGFQLYQTYIGAGLPAPLLRVEHPLIYAADPRWMSMPEMVLRSILPLMEQFGIATAAEVDIDTWTDRLSREVASHDAVCAAPMVVGAWTKRPGL